MAYDDEGAKRHRDEVEEPAVSADAVDELLEEEEEEEGFSDTMDEEKDEY